MSSRQCGILNPKEAGALALEGEEFNRQIRDPATGGVLQSHLDRYRGIPRTRLKFLFLLLSILCARSTPDHLLLDRSPNIGPLISRWELDKFRNC